MIMYKLIKDKDGIQLNQVTRTTDGACIPFDPDNTDYQAYLAWVAQGGQPLPAEEQA
jgi:hypothetical protein